MSMEFCGYCWVYAQGENFSSESHQYLQLKHFRGAGLRPLPREMAIHSKGTERSKEFKALIVALRIAVLRVLMVSYAIFV